MRTEIINQRNKKGDQLFTRHGFNRVGFLFLGFINSPPDRGAVSRLELEDHGEQGGVDVPDAGEDEGDDGEAGHAPHHAHLHVQEPGREVRPLCRPELQAAISLQFENGGQSRIYRMEKIFRVQS